MIPSAARESNAKEAIIAIKEALAQPEQEPVNEADIRADEREACAKVCEETNDGTPYNQAIECAQAIRARGNT
jgi:hypothetical protein